MTLRCSTEGRGAASRLVLLLSPGTWLLLRCRRHPRQAQEPRPFTPRSAMSSRLCQEPRPRLLRPPACPCCTGTELCPAAPQGTPVPDPTAAFETLQTSLGLTDCCRTPHLGASGFETPRKELQSAINSIPTMRLLPTHSTRPSKQWDGASSAWQAPSSTGSRTGCGTVGTKHSKMCS